MFKNEFKVAYRYLINHPSFTLVNILGLTLGFFCFFLLNAYVLRETSFDKDQERVYRLLQKTVDENGTLRETAQTPPKVGIEAKSRFDEIENQTQILFLGRTNIGNDPASVTHQSIAALDNQFLRVFTFPLLEGTVEELTDRPNGFILTKTTKELYFGQESALGKMLKMGDVEYPVGPKRIRMLFKLMGYQTIYRKKNLTKNALKEFIRPYLLRGMQINRANQVWSIDITYIPMKKGFTIYCR